jgi:hypothetical protein
VLQAPTSASVSFNRRAVPTYPTAKSRLRSRPLVENAITVKLLLWNILPCHISVEGAHPLSICHWTSCLRVRGLTSTITLRKLQHPTTFRSNRLHIHQCADFNTCLIVEPNQKRQVRVTSLQLRFSCLFPPVCRTGI